MKSFTLPKLTIGKKGGAAEAAEKPAPLAKEEKPAKSGPKLPSFSRKPKADTAPKAEKPSKEKKEKPPKEPKQPKEKKERKERKPRSEKRRKLPSGGKKQRFVIIIGDEGAILVFTEGRAVLRRLFAPTADIENISTFRSILEENPTVPIYVLVDMMDQSYVKHTLPPVAKLSVQKLIRRRLERDFGPEDITGSLSLGRESGGRKDWNYMLISVAGSTLLMQWLDFILEFDNPFEGLYLVPIEASAITRELSKEELGKDACAWQLLVCHNKVSGFRQVIFKDGKLTFTRLAQPIGDTSPEVVAGNIEQEIANTIEYLKRLSYNEDNGLDCFLIVSAEIKRYVEASKIKARNVILLTPFEAGEILQLDKAAMPEDHYADVVFSAYFGLNPKKVLPLQSKFSVLLLKYRKLITLSIASACVVGLLSLLFTVYNIFDLIPKLNQIELQKAQISKMTAIIAESNSQVSTLPPDIDRREDIVSLYRIFDPHKELLMNFIKDFRRAANEVVIVKKLSWKDGTKMEDIFNKLPIQTSIDMDVEFVDSTGSVDAFALKAREFFARVKAAFPQYTVTYSKLPGIIDQAQSFRAEFTGNEDNKKTQDMLSGEPIVISLSFVPAATNPAAAP